MAFSITPNVHVERDKAGVVRQLRHLQEPYRAAQGHLGVPTPQALAASYLQDVAGFYGIDPSALVALSQEPSAELTDDGTQLRLGAQKTVLETTVISYAETHYGLPIWEAGVTIVLHDQALRVTSSQSTVHHNVQVRKPDPERIRRITARPESGLEGSGLDAGANDSPTSERPQPKITSQRLLIYRYDPAQRYDPESRSRAESGLQSAPPSIDLPAVPESIEAGRHYVVRELLFSYPATGYGEVNWRAFVEVETSAILYLRSFVACCTGSVFLNDPPSTTGDATITAASTAATLDALRSPVTLEGLNPAMPQSLTGEFVAITDTDLPTAAPPTAGAPCNFIYSATTNNFAAVNAYYHLDSLEQIR